MECGNYRGIKLLEIGLKVYERVIEPREGFRQSTKGGDIGLLET